MSDLSYCGEHRKLFAPDGRCPECEATAATLVDEFEHLIAGGFGRCRVWTDEGPLFRDHLAPGYPSEKAKPLPAPHGDCVCKSCKTMRAWHRVKAMTARGDADAQPTE